MSGVPQCVPSREVVPLLFPCRNGDCAQGRYASCHSPTKIWKACESCRFVLFLLVLVNLAGRCNLLSEPHESPLADVRLHTHHHDHYHHVICTSLLNECMCDVCLCVLSLSIPEHFICNSHLNACACVISLQCGCVSTRNLKR